MKNTILVVEDSQEMQDLLALLLPQKGYDLLSATTGSEALALLSSHPELSLILLDLTLPDISAPMFLAEVKKEQLAFAVPIVFFSASSKLLEMNLPEGVVGVIQKPFQISELFSQVDKYSHPQGNETKLPNFPLQNLMDNPSVTLHF